MAFLDIKTRSTGDLDPGQWLATSGENRVAKDSSDVPWDQITKSADKKTAFEIDPDFRIVWSELVRFSQSPPTEFLLDLGIVLFKPEAICKPALILDAIQLCRSSGFEPIACASVCFTPQLTSQLWRYQLNRATLDRLGALFLLFELRGSLALLVKRKMTSTIPCSVALSQLKGSGFRSRMRPDTLRGLFNPLTPMINYVHVSDEPADVVRELAILFPRATRLDIYRKETVACLDYEINEFVEKSMSITEVSDIDTERALERLKLAVGETLGSGEEYRLQLMKYLKELELYERYADVEEILELLVCGQVKYQRWDVLLVASRYMVRTFDGMKELVGKVDPILWRKPAPHSE